jgi:hypothetical protein
MRVQLISAQVAGGAVPPLITKELDEKIAELIKLSFEISAENAL